MILKLFHKLDEEGIFPNSFYEARITPVLKSNYFKKKIILKRRPISLMIIDWKILNEILANQIYKKDNMITKCGLSQECKVGWTLENHSA